MNRRKEAEFEYKTYISYIHTLYMIAQVVLVVKNLHANTGDAGDIRSLGWEDALEKEMATHCSPFLHFQTKNLAS